MRRIHHAHLTTSLLHSSSAHLSQAYQEQLDAQTTINNYVSTAFSVSKPSQPSLVEQEASPLTSAREDNALQDASTARTPLVVLGTTGR